jgi:hypothetical protein
VVHHKKVLVCGQVGGRTKKFGKSLSFEKFRVIEKFSNFSIKFFKQE